MKYVFFWAFITFSFISTSYGQIQRVYLDSNRRISTEANAAFYEEWEEKKNKLVSPFREYYISGKLKKESNYTLEKLNGLYTTLYENGQVESKGKYTMGKKEGVWEYWHENGQTSRKSTFTIISKVVYKDITVKQSVQNGLFGEWHKNGQTKTKGTVKDGNNEGVWEYWYENGQLKQKGNFENDYKEGLWQTWYENGDLKSKGNYNKGGKVGIWETWHKNGQLSTKGSYKELADEEPKEEPLYSWNSMVKTEEDGQWNSWYANGQLREKVNYQEGDLVGSAEVWYADGKKAAEYNFDEGLFVNGWNLDGNQLVTDGKGFMKHYDIDGKLISTGEYKNGLKTGEWTFYTGNDHYIKNFDENKKKLTRLENGLGVIAGKTFTIVEQSAMPVGGMISFYKYIKQNLTYPKSARKLNLMGKVFLSFIVDKNGEVTFVEVIRSVGFSLDREALRVMRQSPRWNPGKQRGRAVRQRMTFPINFKL